LQLLAEALEQLVTEQGKARNRLRVRRVVLRGTHHEPAHHRKGAASAFHKHHTTFKVMGKVERLQGCFHPIQKVFGFLRNAADAEQDGGAIACSLSYGAGVATEIVESSQCRR